MQEKEEIEYLRNKVEYLEKRYRDADREVEKLRLENKTLKDIIERFSTKRKKEKKKSKSTGTKEYKAFRAKILKRDNYKCTQCGSENELEVHHIKEKCNYPELLMVEDNVITLCKECHAKTDNYLCKKHKEERK